MSTFVVCFIVTVWNFSVFPRRDMECCRLRTSFSFPLLSHALLGFVFYSRPLSFFFSTKWVIFINYLKTHMVCLEICFALCSL